MELYYFLREINNVNQFATS